MRQDLAVALSLGGDDDGAASVLGADLARPEVVAAVAGYHLLRPVP